MMYGLCVFESPDVQGNEGKCRGPDLLPCRFYPPPPLVSPALATLPPLSPAPHLSLPLPRPPSLPFVGNSPMSTAPDTPNAPDLPIYCARASDPSANIVFAEDTVCEEHLELYSHPIDVPPSGWTDELWDIERVAASHICSRLPGCNAFELTRSSADDQDAAWAHAVFLAECVPDTAFYPGGRYVATVYFMLPLCDNFPTALSFPSVFAVGSLGSFPSISSLASFPVSESTSYAPLPNLPPSFGSLPAPLMSLPDQSGSSLHPPALPSFVYPPQPAPPVTPPSSTPALGFPPQSPNNSPQSAPPPLHPPPTFSPSP
eukprot:522152-Pleurochrysis_carterae.AAC.1